MAKQLNDKYDKTFLIKTFKEFMEYFTSNEVRKTQLMRFCELTGLFVDIENYGTCTVSHTDDFYLLYKLTKQINFGAPVVGEHRGNSKAKNKFALRRWVYNKTDKWEEMRKLNGVTDRDPIDGNRFLLYKHTRACKTGFNGFHNTSLKEDGVYGTKEMSAQDFETVIATYYNYRYCNESNTEHDKNITVDFIMSDLNCSKGKAEEVLSYINDERKAIDFNCDNLAAFLDGKGHGRLMKLVGSRNSTSFAWRKLGNFTSKKPMSTPKTDLITEDGKIRISVKKAGGAQAMSGAQCESVATLKTALMMYINEVGDTQEARMLRGELDTFLSREWGKYKSNKTRKQLVQENNEYILAEDNEMINPFNDWIKKNVISNKIFKKHLLFEALTGKCKFLPCNIDTVENPDKLIEQLSKPESLSIQEPNYIFIWSLDNRNESYIKSIGEYIDSSIDKERIYARWKQSGDNHNVALTVEIK